MLAAITVLSRLSFYAFSANRSVCCTMKYKKDTFLYFFCRLSKNSIINLLVKCYKGNTFVFARRFRTPPLTNPCLQLVVGVTVVKKLLKLPLHLLCKINKVCLLLEKLSSFTLVIEYRMKKLTACLE